MIPYGRQDIDNVVDVLSRDLVASIRPGYGLPPKYLDDIIGLTVNKRKKRGESLQSKDINVFEITANDL